MSSSKSKDKSRLKGDKDRAALILQKQLKDLAKHPVDGFSAGLGDEGDIFKWHIFIMGATDTIFEGGMFNATLEFPDDYPNMPPTMRFISEMWHPNIYKDGKVCISILHPPGDDKYGYEDSGERWLPIHSVESILLSVISMLSSPNCDSPANVEAGKEYRENKKLFKKKVKRCVRKSQECF